MTFKDFANKVDLVLAKETELYNRFMAAAESHAIIKQHGELVIYIEDDPDQVSMFKTVLANYSTLKVLPAFNAEDGKQLVQRKSGRIKCVVMDLSLDSDDGIGLQSGIALLTWIRRDYPKLPVIVFTSHVELIDQVQRDYPGVEVIAKASSMENVVNVIQHKMLKGVA